MLDEEKIRKVILLAAEPGPRAEYAIRTIIDEARRFAREEGAKAPAPAPAGQGLNALGFNTQGLQGMREDLTLALRLCRGQGG